MHHHTHYYYFFFFAFQFYEKTIYLVCEVKQSWKKTITKWSHTTKSINVYVQRMNIVWCLVLLFFFFLFVFIFLSIFCLSVTWNVDFCITICNIDAHILFSQMIFQVVVVVISHSRKQKRKKIVLCMFVQRKHLLFWHLICDCIRKYVNKLVKNYMCESNVKQDFNALDLFSNFKNRQTWMQT